MTTVALEANRVTKIYKTGISEVRAVDNASVELRSGEFIALVGPSGSGKTTMLAMLAGLLAPSSGHITIDGQDLTTMSDAERTVFRREKIGFAFQANNLVSYLTARENVELMLRLNHQFNKRNKKRAEELLVRLGLEERMNALPRQLSGGQQQRVAIARSLINQPALVLADEPTASLDSERAFQVVQTLASLVHEQKRAGIMVTHDLRLVEYADRVVQMIDGKVVRSIAPNEDFACLADPENCQMIPPETLGFEAQEEIPQVA